MSARRLAAARLLRSLIVPLAIALPPLFWVALASERATLTPLGRDQGIFQYVAWALEHGQIDYRDVRDVNGPLTHVVHVVFLMLGAGREHVFRTLDLVVTGATFACVGACIPGIGAPGIGARAVGAHGIGSRRSARRLPSGPERTAWALAGWVVLSGQYLLYKYWDLAQRESFFDWFMLPSVALQLATQSPWTLGARSPRRQAWLLAGVGALSVVPWFGKPTFAFFTFAQVAAIVADRELLLTRRKALGAFAMGGAVCAAVALVLLYAYADLPAFVRLQLTDVPAFYRFIWPRSAGDIFSNPWCAEQAIFAVLGAVVFGSLILLGEMPGRFVGLALLPLAGLASIVVQGKGFPYHFHPVTAAVHLEWLAFAAWFAEAVRPMTRGRVALRALPVAVAVLLSFRVATAMTDSPYVRAAWMAWDAASEQKRESREYFARFPESDFFPYEMRQAAAYLRTHTKPDDRVQVYGMDPYILFLARRLSATPYIYAYDLDVDTALAGGTGGVPDEIQSAHIAKVRDQHEADLRERLLARPPAAFVFLDGSPLISAEAVEDFDDHCPETAEWMHTHYRETARFGHDRIWLRDDLAPAEPRDSSEPNPPDPR